MKRNIKTWLNIAGVLLLVLVLTSIQPGVKDIWVDVNNILEV